VSGFSLGFWVIAAFAAVAVIGCLALVRSEEIAATPGTATAQL
jgi:hypothetical protein